MLLNPNCPLITIKAKANKIKLLIATKSPVGKPNKLFITRASPVTPPLAILFGKKKNCNPIARKRVPNPIKKYSLINLKTVFLFIKYSFHQKIKKDKYSKTILKLNLKTMIISLKT